MAIISLGKIDQKIIPILLGFVFCFSTRFLYFVETILFAHPVVVGLSISIAKFLNIIPLIIIKIRSKKVHSKLNQSNNKSFNDYEIYHKKIRTKNKNKYIYYLLTAGIFFVIVILQVLTISINVNFWILDIVFTPFFYYLMFKVKLYKHHYLSIILIILIGIVIDTFLGNLQDNIPKNLIYIFIKIIRELLLSFFDVINKYIMETKYCTVYELSFFNGVFTFILIIIFVIFDYYFFKFDDLGEYFDNFNGIEFLIVFAFMITQLGLDICALITEKNYTPCHIFIIYAFGQLAYYIDFSLKSTIAFICFFFIFLISLIFNEIIELNFCGLSDNIKRNIIYRGESEDFLIENNDKVDTVDNNYMIQLKELGKTDDDNNKRNSKDE